MASSSAVDDLLFDCLPSIRRPTAWETSGRNRQIASPQQSQLDSALAEEPFGRVANAPGWRTVHSSSSSPVTGRRRQVIEVRTENSRVFFGAGARTLQL